MQIVIIPIPYKAQNMSRRLQNVLMQTMTEEAAWCKSFFETSVATWEHEVKWKWGARIVGGDLEGYAGTDDLIYKFINGGTKDHAIYPIRAKYLRFAWGGPGSYKPKTVPGIMGSQSGGPTGPIVYQRGVWHPGTEPREFDNIAAAEWYKRLSKRFQESINNALKTT